jgi:hypothetical protein
LRDLKNAFFSAPVLYHFNPKRKIVVHTDASNLIVVGILLQYDDNGILHLVAYISRKHSLMKINYGIYAQENLMIIPAFKQWCPL